MRNSLARSVIVLLLILSVGGHWALLQSVAWMTMVMDYAQESSISEAVSKTFDGRHPCKLCKLVKKGKESEQRQDALKIKTKIDFWAPAPEAALPHSEVAALEFPPLTENLPYLKAAPPLPPPREA